MPEEATTSQRQAEASNPATNIQNLQALSADPALRHSVAGNPAAPANLLERLSRDEDEAVRRAVASNPNTPWYTLERLAEEFPRAFLLNPAGPLQLLAGPQYIRTDEKLWCILLREASIPSLWWNWLLSHPTLSASHLVRLHVRYAGETTDPYGISLKENERITLALAELLMAAWAQGVSLPVLLADAPDRPVVLSEQIVGEHLQRLAHSADVQVREAIASHLQTPAEILRVLAKDEVWRVRRNVARNQHAPMEALLHLAQDKNADVRASVVENQNTPWEVLQTLAGDEDPKVRCLVARNAQTPVEILRTLALDKDGQVRRGVAENVRTPLEVLQVLAHDKDEKVQYGVSGNRQTPAEIAQILALGEAALKVLAEYEQMSIEVLEALARDRERVRRRIAARNEGTPQETLQTLAQDKDVWVRLDVARNTQTPEEQLKILARDKSIHVRKGVAGNEQMPVEAWQILARDTSIEVRKALARNTQASNEILQILVRDPDRSVRQIVAASQQVSVEVLQVLAQDSQAPVRQVVVENEKTPVEILQVLAQDKSLHVRRAVARSTLVPGEVLQMLAQDAQARVREAVAWNRQTPVAILQVLAQDEEANVRKQAHHVLRLLCETEEGSLHGREWRERIGRLLLDLDRGPYDDPLGDTPPQNQLSLIAKHSDMPDSVRQTTLAILAADWDDSKVRAAFVVYGSAFAGDLSVRRENYQRILAPFMPPIALQKLATSPLWEVRYLVALHRNTPWETRLYLGQDSNRYVRAMARAKMKQESEQ